MSAKAELSNLIELLRSKVGDQSASGIIDVLLYFDEAHNLTSGPEEPWLLYDILRSVFRDYVDTPLFALFISTSARIAQFAPPQGVTNGLRMIKSNAHHAPITETPFDCDPDILVEQDLYNRQDVAELRFMARFGRPLCVCQTLLVCLPCLIDANLAIGLGSSRSRRTKKCPPLLA